MPDKRRNQRGVAEQHRRPLAAVTSNKAVEVFESHSGRPLVERAGLAGLVGRRVVILSEPRSAVAVLLQNAADRGGVLRKDAVVALESGGLLRDHAKAFRVVVAASDEGGACWRAQRRGVEIRVAQPV